LQPADRSWIIRPLLPRHAADQRRWQSPSKAASWQVPAGSLDPRGQVAADPMRPVELLQSCHSALAD
jgi:hypothetical protein